MQKPLISVIVATYKAASTLDRCLTSVASQTYDNKELVVMDGGSPDATVDILKRHSDEITYWESEPDRGIYHAWNKALSHAKGDWIMFLGADDYFWEPDVLERMSRELVQVPPSTRLVYGKVAVVAHNGTIIRMEGLPWETAKLDFRDGMSIPHAGLMHHRSLFEEHGNFDESYRIIGDYEFLLRELPDGDALFVPEITTVGFQHGGLSNSPSATQKIMAELAVARRKHGLPQNFSMRTARMQLKTTACALAVRVVGEDGFRYLADAYRKATGRPTIWR